MKIILEPGLPYPLGSSVDKDGVNFALFSAHATRVELCLFNEDGSKEIGRVDLPEVSNQIWHGYLPKANTSTVYAYRVHGPYQPQLGHRFNANKLLLDPYAKQFVGKFTWSELHFGFDPAELDLDSKIDIRDNQHFMPKCKVFSPLGGQSLRANRINKADSIIYETHLKGFTMMHPNIPMHERGTFKGLAHKEAIAYLKSLGITSVELLPIQYFINEAFLEKKDLSNYWGYNTLSFFAPHPTYLSANDPRE